MSDTTIPDEWDNVSDEDEVIVNNLIKLEIENKIKQQQQELEDEEEEKQENEKVNETTTLKTTTKNEIPSELLLSYKETLNNNLELEKDEDEEPLLLINFTKWSYNKIKWINGKIENSDLFERLMNKLNQEEEFFQTMTDDLLEREYAFHTTNKQWRNDIKTLEKLYPGDFFSSLSYPPMLGGFLLDQIWLKIKERTEWKSVNILKCIYLAKTNRSLLYKHNMALAIELLALEQKLLGPTAKRLKDEEDLEDAKKLRAYQEMMQKRYENEINEGIIRNLQQAVYTSEGINQNINKIHNNRINEINDDYQQQQQQDDDDDDDYDDDENNDDDYNDDDNGSYCSTCDGRNSDDQMNDQDEDEDDEEDTNSTSFQQTDDDEADNELDEEDNRKKKKEKLIEERKIKEIEQERLKKENEKKLIEQPPPPTLNVLDKIIAMIFSKLTISTSKEFHYEMLKRLDSSIKETWIEEFGCLPPNCLWREEQE